MAMDDAVINPSRTNSSIDCTLAPQDAAVRICTAFGYEWVAPDRWITRAGEVFALDRRTGARKPLTPTADGDGYLQVFLAAAAGRGRKVRVHRIVAACFHPVPSGTPDAWQVDHRNHQKTDNRADNLAWATPQENTCRRRRNLPRMNERDIATARFLLASGMNASQISRGVGGAVSSRRIRSEARAYAGPVPDCAVWQHEPTITATGRVDPFPLARGQVEDLADIGFPGGTLEPVNDPVSLEEVLKALEAEGPKEAAAFLRGAMEEAAREAEEEVARKDRVAAAVERLDNLTRRQRPTKAKRKASLLRATQDVRHIRLNSRELRGHAASEKAKAWMTALFPAQQEAERKPPSRSFLRDRTIITGTAPPVAPS